MCVCVSLGACRSQALIRRYTTLCTGLLHKVTLYSDINLMTPNNVAIVFAPNILRPPNENVSLALLDCASSNNLVRCMIEEYDLIFGEVRSTVLSVQQDGSLTPSSSSSSPSSSGYAQDRGTRARTPRSGAYHRRAARRRPGTLLAGGLIAGA